MRASLVLARLKAHHLGKTGGVSHAFKVSDSSEQARLLRLSQSPFRAHTEFSLKV